MKRTIVWMFCLAIIVLLLSTGVQAQELTDVPASDILEQIENGKDIYLKNVRITGELNVSKIELKTVLSPPMTLRAYARLTYRGHEYLEELKIIESKIIIKDSIFENCVDFSNILLRKTIDFQGTSFSGKTDFFGANFSDAADFSYANFSDAADFSGASFSDAADFSGASFSDAADFRDASFSDAADFRDASFGDAANFRDANFAGYVYFNYANFAGYVYFNYANFAGYADFRDANFTRYVYFNYANFAGYADFRDANFTRYADFRDAKFTGDATFFSTEFDGVSFTGTRFTKVSLKETDFNQMNVEWRTLKDALVFDGPTYKKIIKNFREMEQFGDADAAYYQYRILSQADKEWSLSKLIDLVARGFFGYGLKPENILLWAVILIIVFALVYWRGDGIRRLKENDGANNRATFWDAIYFSVSTISTVGYGDWYPVDRYRIWVMLEGFLGWLFLALFIATFTDVILN